MGGKLECFCPQRATIVTFGVRFWEINYLKKSNPGVQNGMPNEGF